MQSLLMALSCSKLTASAALAFDYLERLLAIAWPFSRRRCNPRAVRSGDFIRHLVSVSTAAASGKLHRHINLGVSKRSPLMRDASYTPLKRACTSGPNTLCVSFLCGGIGGAGLGCAAGQSALKMWCNFVIQLGLQSSMQYSQACLSLTATFKVSCCHLMGSVAHIGIEPSLQWFPNLWHDSDLRLWDHPASEMAPGVRTACML